MKIKKDRKIGEIKTILYVPKEEKDYYKPIKINKAFNNNYIEYQSNGDKDKTISIEEYLDATKPYLSNMKNNHNQGEWKIQLSLIVNFVPFETRIMYTDSDNIDIMIGSETDEIIEKLFESLLEIYQKWIRRKDEKK